MKSKKSLTIQLHQAAFVCLTLSAALCSSARAVQDPGLSINQMKLSLNAKNVEISHIDSQIKSDRLTASQRKALLDKKAKLTLDIDSLRSSIAMGEAVRENPFVLYGNDRPAPIASKSTTAESSSQSQASSRK